MSRLQMSANFEQIRRPPEHPETPRPKAPPEPLWKRLSLNPGAIVVVGSLALGLGLFASLHSTAPSQSAAPAVALVAPPVVETPAPVPATPVVAAKIEAATPAPAPVTVPVVAAPAHVDPVTTGTIAPKKPKHKPKVKQPKPAAGDE